MIQLNTFLRIFKLEKAKAITFLMKGKIYEIKDYSGQFSWTQALEQMSRCD